MCGFCSKLTIKTSGRCQFRCSGVLIVNFVKFKYYFGVPIVDFEQVNVG